MGFWQYLHNFMLQLDKSCVYISLALRDTFFISKSDFSCLYFIIVLQHPVQIAAHYCHGYWQIYFYLVGIKLFSE